MYIYAVQVQEDTHTQTHIPDISAVLKPGSWHKMDIVEVQKPQGQLGLHKKHVLLGGLFTFLSTHFQWQQHNFLLRLVRAWLWDSKCNLCNPKSLFQPKMLLNSSYFLSFSFFLSSGKRLPVICTHRLTHYPLAKNHCFKSHS